MKKTKREQQMAQLLEEQAQSGQSKERFCAERGITPSTFYYWQRQLRERDEPSGEFTALKVEAVYELEVRSQTGHWLSLRSHNASSLAAVLSAMSLEHA